MKADTLKKSILQYAMQGKLVPQDPNDEPASELLKRIKAEKDQLIKDGKIKKEKPLSPITQDEIPYDLPQGWQWVRLGELGITTTGTTPSTNKPEFFGGKYSFVKPADITNSGKIIYNKQTLSDLGIKNGRFIPKNSILMVCIGGSIGKVGFTQKDCSCNQQINAITPFIDDLANYIFIALISPYFFNKVLSVAPQTTLPIISKGKWESLIIPLPPLAEQKRIVEKLEEILPLIDEYGKNEEILSEMNQKLPKQIRRSILQYAVQGKLVPQDPQDEPASELLKRIKAEKEQLIKEGKIKKEKPLPPITQDEIPYDLPQGWQWVRLGSICSINPRNIADDDTNAGFIPMSQIKDGYNNEHSFEIKKWKDIKKGFTHFKNGDIVIAKITPCFQNRKSAIIKNLPNDIGAGTTELHVIREDTSILLKKYLLLIFKTELFIKNGIKNFTGTAGQQRIGKDFIVNYLIPLPPLAEQKRIVVKVEELLNLVNKLEVKEV